MKNWNQESHTYNHHPTSHLLLMLSQMVINFPIQFLSFTNHNHQLQPNLWMWLYFWAFLQWLYLLVTTALISWTVCVITEGTWNPSSKCYCPYHPYHGEFLGSDGRTGKAIISHQLWWTTTPLVATEEGGAYFNQSSLDYFFSTIWHYLNASSSLQYG